MKISLNPREHILEVVVEGRLDATWAEPFLEALRGALRDGQHHIRVDAAGLEYLSSAGIRSLLQVHRELLAVNGSFAIRRALPFVADTLSMSGFGQWLESAETPEGGEPQAASAEQPDRQLSRDGMDVGVLSLAAERPLALRRVGDWRPWQTVSDDACATESFAADRFALGIGAPGGSGVRERLGEFLAAAGCVAYLPGDGFETPDYLVGAERFIPSLEVIEALVCEGDFSHLLRFDPRQEQARLPLTSLAECALEAADAEAVGFLLIAEIDGLVGAALTRSPGLIDAAVDPGDFPEIRNWLTFCGERAHREQQALVTGVACRRDHPLAALLPASPSRPELFCHAHAAVFPFRPLPRGRIEACPWVGHLFETGTPQAILHLLEDDRPVLGLGQSAFVRGACWCAALDIREDLEA